MTRILEGIDQVYNYLKIFCNNLASGMPHTVLQSSKKNKRFWKLRMSEFQNWILTVHYNCVQRTPVTIPIPIAIYHMNKYSSYYFSEFSVHTLKSAEIKLLITNNVVLTLSMCIFVFTLYGWFSCCFLLLKVQQQ